MKPWPYPLWVAHRGAGTLAPENTLAAFRLGARYGYRAFECDVKLSRDGQAFLLHDADLQRTSSGQGLAADHDWASLSLLDAGSWHSRGYAGEPLPSLPAIAAFCLANGHALNIEIKPSPGTADETGRQVALAAQRLWQDAAMAPLLSSFEPEALQAAQRAAPSLPRALLVDTLWAGWFAQALDLGCIAVVANHHLYTATLIEQLHEAGLRALAYTVNDPESARALIRWGIDGLITDVVDRFAPGIGPAAAGISERRA